MISLTTAVRFTGLLLLMTSLGCTRNTIEFGTVPENNYTRLVYIDTVGVRLSTVLTDSFATGNASSFLTGRYKDPYLGIISATPFFQLDKPAEPGIPTGAIYDSVTFIIRLNDYYYGDTSRPQTIAVNELADPIVTGYNNALYNTSSVAIKPVPLGAKIVVIRPVADDSVSIRLSDSKGMELFTKLQQQSADVIYHENFLNYFKGISLTTGINDTTAVFGWLGTAVMRIHYHTNTPYEELHTIDFPSVANELAFNRVTANRTGTGLVPGTTGTTEIPSSQTNNYAFAQPGTGLNLKITFPSLRDILLTHKYVRLLKAELIIRPAYLSFDRSKYRLPENLSLVYTDATNLAGSSLPDSTGGAVMYASPFIDDIYGQNTHYRFNVTSYVSQLLQIAGTEATGLYIMPSFSATTPEVSRLVMESMAHSGYTTQLQLSVLIVNE